MIRHKAKDSEVGCDEGQEKAKISQQGNHRATKAEELVKGELKFHFLWRYECMIKMGAGK